MLSTELSLPILPAPMSPKKPTRGAATDCLRLRVNPRTVTIVSAPGQPRPRRLRRWGPQPWRKADHAATWGAAKGPCSVPDLSPIVSGNGSTPAGPQRTTAPVGSLRRNPRSTRRPGERPDAVAGLPGADPGWYNESALWGTHALLAPGGHA